MEFYEVLLPVGLILLFSKLIGLGSKKIGLPQVIAMLLAGVILGLVNMIPGLNLITDNAKSGLNFLAKIGVVLIMFSAGIETDLRQIKQTGIASLVITVLGVIVPMGAGFVVALLFFPGESIITQLFYGVILTATSVSVTVAVLKELGKLNSKVGTAIVSAAIIDDVIGIILLSFLLSLSGGASVETTSPLIVVLKTVGFFVASIGVGIALRYLFKYIEKKHPHTRRIPIFSYAMCFIFAFCAEKVFGVADITGAYIAGLCLSNLHSAHYVERKIDISSYMIFGPIFFANIGINIEFASIDASMIGFGLCFVIAGILGKLVGCGMGAKMCKFNFKDSVRVGLGMMVRAEVVLVCTQKGVDAGIIDNSIMPFILLLILITSFLTPLFLKLSYRNDPSLPLDPDNKGGLSPLNKDTENTETAVHQDSAVSQNSENGNNSFSESQYIERNTESPDNVNQKGT